MAQLLAKSEKNIQAEMLATLITELGLNDVNRGSVIDVITQAAAQQDFSLYYQVIQLSRLNNIDSLTGSDIDTKAFEYGITRRQASKARGLISILRPTGFVKVSTTFYAGSPSPIVGQITIDVNDASSLLIGTTGTLILGRGTNNEEEVTYSIAPANNVTYYTYTLDAALTKDHAIEETVILKQGNDEIILAGTVVRVLATGTTAEIIFNIDNDTTLLSGEDRIEGVEVTAAVAGTTGNIPVGAISGTDAFPSAPFSGARASNSGKFTTGQDRETDDGLRDRIKSAIPGISKGVKQAIQTAIVGLVDAETAKRVVSASIILPESETGPVLVYFDDGTGFEPSFESQGFETVLANSTGGEQRLQLDSFPLVKAQLETNLQEPYNMSSGALTLIYEVGNINETITFNPADFRSPSIATAEEIASAINDKTTLLEARTSQNGKQVVINAKAETNENLQILGGTSNSIIAFPTDRKDTLNLYIDDVLMSKDGNTAVLDSGNQAPYNLLAIGAYPHTINIVIDGKTANPQIATINLVDVADSSAVTVAEIVAVLNRDFAGITAVGINSNTRVRIKSNTQLSLSSRVNVTGGTANNVTNGLNFSLTETVGSNGDYKLNRELGIIELASPLIMDQTVTSGSIYTRGRLRAALAENYAPANLTTLVISVDGGANQTITFDNSFTGGVSAAATASFINGLLVGATAIVRQVGGINFLEINTNTLDITGSIEIKSTSTANSVFNFVLNTPVQSGNPNAAYKVSGSVGPYDFAEGDSLVVVIDNDIVNNTYSILMNYAALLTAVSSTTIFSASTLTSVFDTSNELQNFYAAFTGGPNTGTGVITSVTDMGGNIARYFFTTNPVNFGIFSVGDLFKVNSLGDSENNGNFLITGLGANYVQVVSADVVNATGQTGNATLSQRRLIQSYNNLTGQVITSSAFSNIPVIGNNLLVIPGSVRNVVNYTNNTKITSISLKANVEGVIGNTKVQISSKADGSDGYVQVTGGEANRELNFNTSVLRGISAYNFYTGLLKLVHRTIYGDDSDLVSFPGVGAAGITFHPLPPTVKELNVQLDVTLQEGVSIGTLENEIKSAVSGYINTLGVGEDIIIERIRAAVIAITGIIDVVIIEPSANIAIADNELARISDTAILIG